MSGCKHTHFMMWNIIKKKNENRIQRKMRYYDWFQPLTLCSFHFYSNGSRIFMIRTYENPIIISFSCKWIYCNQNSWIFIIIFSINETQNNQAIDIQLLNVYDWFNCSLLSLFDSNHYYIGRSFIPIKVVEIKYFLLWYQHNITSHFILFFYLLFVIIRHSCVS